MTGSYSADRTSWHSTWALERLAVLHGHRDRGVRRRRDDHEDGHVPHAHPGDDVLRAHLRGVQADLRRRDADHRDVQRAGAGQGGGRAVDRDPDLQAGDRRVVLGRQPDARLPAARLLAGAHHGLVHRALRRGGGRAGGVRVPHADPDVRHRRLGDRGRVHQDAQDADLRQRPPQVRLADQLGQAGRRHARTAPT